MAIFTAIATAVVSAFALPATVLGISTAALIGGGLAIGASVGISALLGGKNKPKAAPGPTPQAQATLNQSVGPRVRGYGRAKLGGTRAFWDSANGDLVQAVMVHSGEIDVFEEWWIGDIQVSLNVSDQVTTEPFFGFVAIESFTGTAPQSNSSIIIDRFSGIWTSAHRLDGIAYFVTVFSSPESEDYQKVYPDGYNTPVRAVARLSKVYDPRTTLTAWSDNAALVILDYLTHEDGYRLSLSDIDLTSFTAFANVCDQAVSLKAGGTEARYRIWGVYSFTEDPEDVLGRMEAACDGELYQTPGGKIGIKGGAWEAPTVTLTPQHIKSVEFQQGSNRFAAFNELKILHTSPDHDYQTMELSSWVDLAAQAEMGPLPSDVTYDLVPSPSQALRLAKIHIAKQNPRWRGTVVTNVLGIDAIGQRTIHIEWPELEIDDDFLVLGHTLSPSLESCEIAVSSLESTAYDWNHLTEELDPAPEPQDTRPDLVIEAPEGLYLRVVTGPAVKATVDAPTRTGLSLEAEIRIATGPGAWIAMSVAAGALEAYSGTLVSGTTYEVRARWLTAQNASGEWSDPVSIPVVNSPATPAAATGFTATKVGATADLDWTHSVTSGFYFTEVYRGTTTTFGAATKLTEVYGAAGAVATYLDPSPGVGTRYYWVRSVNVAGVAGTETGPQSLTFP